MTESLITTSSALENGNAGHDHKQHSVFLEAAEQMPSAVKEWAQDAWSNKGQFIKNTAIELGESALAGGVISYLIPSQGKAAMALGVLMMTPVMYAMGKGAYDAHEAAEKPGANIEKIGHQLALKTVDGAYNLGVSFAGGYAGAELGGALALSDTAAGRFSRSIRSNVFGENISMGELQVQSLQQNDNSQTLADRFSENAKKGAPPPVVDGPAGVLTSLEGVPRSEVTVTGTVSKLLADDSKGLPHQRFLVQLSDKSNIFIANDTHYGTAVPGLQLGQAITLRGEWIPEPGSWDGTSTAGVLHWTHKGDSGSSHPGGWIDYGGKRYDLLGGLGKLPNS